ncbi:sugar phosphate isomerase/epimerase family protein [Arenibaculum sp.]|jgi:sugar phosphate isomerase/epimerase|uniref:sugar phosphate isomerase/epimerase family protein n=1 Tax=Arenibaculum sp. TaxID=2865862 RepID=UPI002E0D21BC|nr:sugar phosphate isomerase/epimerase family protein [Arenibaculum sp.]
MTARPLHDHSRLSINDATTKAQWTLEQAIQGYSAQGVRGISVWRDKLAECGVPRAAALLADHGMTVTGLCRGGMFPAPTAVERRAAIDDNRRAIEEAVAIGAQCLVLVAGGLPKGAKDLVGARMMVQDGIAAVLEEARAAGMPLAIEPLHPMYAADRCCINTMAQANDLCDRLGPGVGIAVDVYHVWWDPDLDRQIRRAGKDRLLAFHICDWLIPTRDLLLDRGMMGDGIIDIPLIRGWVEEAGYEGFHEVEIFSAETWWKRDPNEVVTVCKERYLTVV